MSPSVPRAASFVPLAAALAVLLFAATGCNPIGCFEASEAGGTCPSQDEAITYFDDPLCGGRVASVDSPPSIEKGEPGEGNLCCYAITMQEPRFDDCSGF